ncbi:MAG TPA: purine-nucleoside phosphorylase [Clostridiales bacterium]|nr:purine-nucleoside phosphorylase [Clostridiales bacterium]
MMNVPTPHNAARPGDIAQKVLMPGDPLRAKFIAETYLDQVQCFTTVRNMFGYTGHFKGRPVSVMGSGMGIPSIGIYSYELYNFYDVDSIIRVGSAGALADELQLMDVVIAMGACTNSNYATQFRLPGTFAPIADFGLLRRAVEVAETQNLPYKVGNVLSSDTFYNADKTADDLWKSMGVLGIEMEAAGLYMNAIKAKKKALAILTISDHIYRPEALTAEERQVGFNRMIELALEI